MTSNNFDMEQSLIGGLMKLKTDESEIANYIFATLKPGAFYSMVNREIYKTLVFLSANKMMFDHLTVSKAISNHAYVSLNDVDRCYQCYGDTSVLRQYTNTIRDSSIERHTLTKIQDLPDLITNEENGSISERIGLAESVFTAIIETMQKRKGTGLKDGRELGSKWMDSLEEFSNGTNSVFDFGIKGLDEIIAPKKIKAGSLVVVGARPKMGKTFFATKVASHYVNNRKEACCIFSLEMGDTDIYERMLADKAKTHSDNFYTIPFENTSYWDDIGNSNLELSNTKIFIDDTPGITIRHIKSEVRKVHKKENIGCIIVDYLTLMDGDTKTERNDLKYGEITKQLKTLAKELCCVVLLLTQLNRGLESRPDKRPVPSDSRDTGQIEQDCDIWIGLYRDKVYNENVNYNFTEAIIRLNRHGNSGTGYLTLENGYFEDVDTLLAQSEIENYKAMTEDRNNDSKQSYTKKYKR